MDKKAVVLLSGGMDSATAFYQAILDVGKENVIPIFFNYGQRNLLSEKTAATRLVDKAKTQKLIKINLEPSFKQLENALTDDTVHLLKGRTPDEIKADFDTEDAPSTFVPGRNIIFLSYAFGLSHCFDANLIYSGMNDNVGFPDNTPEFFKAMEIAGSTGIGRIIKFIFPTQGKTKTDIVRLGESLSVPWKFTISCYEQESPFEKPCGKCDSCILRKEGFEKADIADPADKLRL